MSTKKRIVDVRDFGKLRDDGTMGSSAIQAAHDWLLATESNDRTGGTIHVSCDIFIERPILFDAHKIGFRGDRTH